MRPYLRAVRALVRKDVLLERRSRQTLAATGAFAFLLAVVFHFGFDIQGGEARRFFPGALWIALLFAGTLGLAKGGAGDDGEGSGRGLVLAPIDRSALYVAKFIYHLMLMAVVEAVVVPLFLAAFSFGAVALPGFFILGLVLGTWGFVAVGTLLAAVAGEIKGAGLVAPIILFPLLVPVALGGVALVGAGVTGEADPRVAAWIRLLVMYDVLFTVIPAMLYEYVAEG